MTASERRNTIINYLQTKQDCDVNEIIDQFDVTPATIRRDLTFLENSGSISRTHGAVHLVKTPAVPGFLTRNTLFAEEKQAMARVAAQMVQSGDSVMLDSGTTVHAVAIEVGKRSDITLITNSLSIVSALEAPKQNILLTGGVFEYDNLALVGPDVELFLDRISASILFLGATGIRGCDGLTVISPLQAGVKRKMIQCAKKRVLVIDNSKFASTGMVLFASFEEIDTIIVARPIEDPILKRHLDEIGVQVIVALPEQG